VPLVCSIIVRERSLGRRPFVPKGPLGAKLGEPLRQAVSDHHHP